MRLEFQKIEGNKKKQLDMKSALNVTETKVRTFQRKLEESIANLADAETLLDRAIRIKEQQDKLLPLFQILSQESRGRACRLDLALASVIILSTGTFDQKLTQLLRAYDPDQSGTFNIQFLVAIQVLFHEAFYMLNYLPYPPSRDEIIHTTERILSSYCTTLPPQVLSSSSSSLTYSSLSSIVLNQYELKQFLINAIGTSKKLCSLIGVLPSERYSTYQRNQMSFLSLNRLNLISYSTTQYRAHHSITQYRPLLAPEHVRQIHDFALNKGTVDPNRPNYQKFLKKVKSTNDSDLVPLDTGHLMNVKVYSDRIRNNAALKIQTIMRAYLHRREAEFEAKRQAFSQARKFALLEMKEKVLKEFKRREAFEGTAKMKWDAQVRMRQAKLRSSGTNLSRADVVMILMEEAIGRATTEIETRFAALEKEQGLEPVKVQEEDVMAEEEKKGDEDLTGEGIFKLFGLIKRQVMADELIIKEEEVEVATPRDDDEVLPGGGGGGASSDKKPDQPHISSPTTPSQEKLEEIQQLKNRSQLMLLGSYQYDPLARGETINETILRLELSLTDPIHDHFSRRISSIDKNITTLKLNNLLLEYPSKRLLLKYLLTISPYEFEMDLRKHYKIIRNNSYIATIFYNILNSDDNYGLQLQYIYQFINKIEEIFQNYIQNSYFQHQQDMELMIEKRFHNSDGRINEINLIQIELDRIKTHLSRYQSQSNEIIQNITQLKQKYQTLNYSIHEMEKREFVMKNILYQKMGYPLQRIVITEKYRYDWIRRINYALHLKVTPNMGNGAATSASTTTSASTNIHGAEMKFHEIRNICHEFLEFATMDAMTIIREHRLNPEFQSIPIILNEAVKGRGAGSGRGIKGRYLLYEAHSIEYYICLDYTGAFDGNDEYAMKAGSLDRLGSLEYFKCHIPRLHIPLIATIDYFGFRVVAISKLPIEQISFTDEGEVKRLKIDLQYGLKDNGEKFINKSKTLQSLLRQTSYRLNIIEHSCKGLNDMTGSATYASSELKAYKGAGGGGAGGGAGGGEDDGFYLKDFWRTFPSEDPEETPHLLQISRQQSIFWRQLRPEYVKRYKKALNPDALCVTSYQQPDLEEHLSDIKMATHSMIQSLLPQYAESLCSREYKYPLMDGYGIDFSMELHDLGINIRHLGYIRGLMWRKLPGIFNLYFNDHYIRTSMDLRDEVKHGMVIDIADLQFTVTETTSRKISYNRIPIEKLYVGMSKRNQFAYGGYLKSSPSPPTASSASASSTSSHTPNCDGIRSVLLAEMTCRTMKNMIRQYLRQYSIYENGISINFQRQLICKFLNILTGSSPESNEFLMNSIYNGIRSRFGNTSVMFSERYHLQLSLMSCIPYSIKRIQKMLGIQISSSSLTEFAEHYENYVFVPMDIISIQPIVRHNMPALAYSDAMLVSMYATGKCNIICVCICLSLCVN